MGNICISSQKESSQKSFYPNLYIITPFFNPANDPHRLVLHNEFIERFKVCTFLQLVTVECSYKGSPFFYPESKYNYRTFANSSLWLKENILNFALKKLSQDPVFIHQGKYVAWIDDDIEFVDNNWFSKLEKSLKNFTIVQMFKKCYFMDKNRKTLETHFSFGYYYSTADLHIKTSQYPHPGYAWCTTKEKMLDLLKNANGLYDIGIFGSGDKQMAEAIIGKFKNGFVENFKYHQNYLDSLEQWQNNVLPIFQKKLGFVNVAIRHHWHGSRKSRLQLERWSILSKYKFDPYHHLIRDEEGIIKLQFGAEIFEQEMQRIFNSMAENKNEGEGILKIKSNKKQTYRNVYFYGGNNDETKKINDEGFEGGESLFINFQEAKAEGRKKGKNIVVVKVKVKDGALEKNEGKIMVKDPRKIKILKMVECFKYYKV